jgi:hypothetical protein
MTFSMRPKLLPIAVLLAALGQWALVRGPYGTLNTFLFWLAVPGFAAAMIFGLDGEPGTTPMTRPVEFLISVLIYFVLVSVIVLGYDSLFRRVVKRSHQ